MRAKGTKSAVIAAALSVVLCVGMLAGTTFAWFTDTVTSAGNIIGRGQPRSRPVLCGRLERRGYRLAGRVRRRDL